MCTDLVVASEWFFRYSCLCTVMITIYIYIFFLGGGGGGRGSFYSSNTLQRTLVKQRPQDIKQCQRIWEIWRLWMSPLLAIPSSPHIQTLYLRCLPKEHRHSTLYRFLLLHYSSLYYEPFYLTARHSQCSLYLCVGQECASGLTKGLKRWWKWNVRLWIEKKNDCFAVYPLIQDSKSNNTLILLFVCNSKVSLGSPLPNLFTDLSRTM